MSKQENNVFEVSYGETVLMEKEGASQGKKDFLSITDLSAGEIRDVLFLAEAFKKGEQENTLPFAGKTAVMLFEKPSLRTKLSFDLAISQLGGKAIYFGGEEVGLGKREPVSDVSKVVGSMADLIVARVFNHSDLQTMAKNSKMPVVNALSDLEHPCQALADLLTIFEQKQKWYGLNLAYVGDGDNNVAHSLCLASAALGINFACASPKMYELDKGIVQKAKLLAQKTEANFLQTVDPKEAVENADVVVTDTWASMGDEGIEQRMQIFKPYQVNQSLMNLAKPDAIFMHCLPAHRGSEVTDEVIDGPQSVVFQEAENRLHAQKALLWRLFAS